MDYIVHGVTKSWARLSDFHSTPLPINNIVIVLGEQQRDPAIYIHVPIAPSDSLLSRLPHSTEKISLCYTVGPCSLLVLNIAGCACPLQLPSYLCPLFHSSSLAILNSFSKSVSLFLFCRFICIIYFLISTYKGCHMLFLLL